MSGEKGTPRISDSKRIGKQTWVVSGYGAPSNRQSEFLPKFRKALSRPVSKPAGKARPK
jgi:hypothetical protein